jgi:hypothetical protein
MQTIATTVLLFSASAAYVDHAKFVFKIDVPQVAAKIQNKT